MVTTNKKKDTEKPLDNFLTDDNNIITFDNSPTMISSGCDSSIWISGTGTATQTMNTTSLDFSSNDTLIIDDGSTWNWTTSNVTTFSDPYSELEELRQEQEDEEKLREEYPCLQEAYDNYQLIKKLLQDEECDKYFDDKMRVFKK